MRKISEIARLKFDLKLSNRAIGRSCQISPTTAGKVIRELVARGITTYAGFTAAAAIEPGLTAESAPAPGTYPFPEVGQLQRELKQPGVTRKILWEEYRVAEKVGYSYSQFCARFRELTKGAEPVLRFTHRAGEKVFIDYSGKKPEIVDQETGVVTKVELFVGVLGASNYTYAEATMDQTKRNFIGSQIRMFTVFGGVVVAIVPDNLKSGVTRADYYDPDLNPSYQEFAEHYGVAILPARPAEPRDKAKVENAVQQVQRWILGRLRNRTFFSLAELNAAIREQVAALNAAPFTGQDGSRAELFAAVDQPALRPLPAQAYEYADWQKVTVHIDYHVDLGRVYYSAPYQLIGHRLWCRYTTGSVQLYQERKLVATHVRRYKRGVFHTIPEHRPPSHAALLAWTPERMRDWGAQIGPNAAALVEQVFLQLRHPEQGYRVCLGVLGLTRHYPAARLERACRRALDADCLRVWYLKNLLKNELEDEPVAADPPREFSQDHAHLRGGHYYQPALEVDDDPTQPRH